MTKVLFASYLPADIYLPTKGTQDQYVKSVQSQQQRHQSDVNDVVLVTLLFTLNRF